MKSFRWQLILALIAGLALGVLSERVGDLVISTVAGALGGLLAGIVFSLSAGVLAAYVLPVTAPHLLFRESTETLLPEGVVNRVLWIGLTGVSLGITIPALKLTRKRRTSGVSDKAVAK